MASKAVHPSAQNVSWRYPMRKPRGSGFSFPPKSPESDSSYLDLPRRKLFDKFMKFAAFLLFFRAIMTLAFAVMADGIVGSFYMDGGRALVTVPALLYLKTFQLLLLCSSLLAMRAFVVSLSRPSINLHRAMCGIEACLSLWVLLALAVDYEFAPFLQENLITDDERVLYFVLLFFNVVSIALTRWHAFRIYHMWKVMVEVESMREKRGDDGEKSAEHVVDLMNAIEAIAARKEATGSIPPLALSAIESQSQLQLFSESMSEVISAKEFNARWFSIPESTTFTSQVSSFPSYAAVIRHLQERSFHLVFSDRGRAGQEIYYFYAQADAIPCLGEMIFYLETHQAQTTLKCQVQTQASQFVEGLQLNLLLGANQKLHL